MQYDRRNASHDTVRFSIKSNTQVQLVDVPESLQCRMDKIGKSVAHLIKRNFASDQGNLGGFNDHESATQRSRDRPNFHVGILIEVVLSARLATMSNSLMPRKIKEPTGRSSAYFWDTIL